MDLERIEKGRRARIERNQQKRAFSEPAPSGNKKFKGGQQSYQSGGQKQGYQAPTISQSGSVANTQRSGTMKTNRPPCVHCGKNHPGECWTKTGACFLCGSMEHRKADCPRRRSSQDGRSKSELPSIQRTSQPNRSGIQRTQSQTVNKQESRAPARVYAMRAREDQNDAEVIVGMFSLFENFMCALIDPGSTHSYICKKLPVNDELRVEILSYDILVSSPLGVSESVNRVFRECPIMIKGKVYSGDLIELPFHEFDLILGMDWLSKHGVMVDCKNKKITLMSGSDEEMIVWGERLVGMTNVISAALAARMIRRGCEAFIAHIVLTENAGLDLQTIPIVCDYPDVFPEELPGLPPDREVEFAIEVLPGTAPIFRCTL